MVTHYMQKKLNNYDVSGKPNNIKGLIDTHIHTSPDIKPRICNDLEIAKLASEAGMSAIVIKSHIESTVSRAKLVNDLYPIDVFGGISLNNAIGGINPEAVNISAKLGGKIVWLPTIDFKRLSCNFFKNFSDELNEIYNIISENDMVLATGHLNPRFIFRVIDDAYSCGVKKIIVNHPLTSVVAASIEEQKEMSKHAFLEHCFVACMPKHDNLNIQKIYDAIIEVGYNKCILASDFGQIHNSLPTLGFSRFIDNLVSRGLTEKEINHMCNTNPKNLLY